MGKLGAVAEGTARRNDGIPEAQSANLHTQVAIGGCHTEDEDTMKLSWARPESGCGVSISGRVSQVLRTARVRRRSEG